MESQTIQISFINEKFKRYPKVKIFIDGDLLEEKEFTTKNETVQIPIDLLDGKHKLEIEHFDKTNSDTEFKNNSILRDTKFKVENIKILGYDLPFSFFLNCYFEPDWKDLTKPKNFPNKITKSQHVGPNGVWTLNFETPVDDWLINTRKRETEKELEKMVTYVSYEPSEHSKIDHRLTDEDQKLIQEIKQLI